VSNLTLACTSCNQRKGNQDVRDFLKEQPERLARLLAQLKAPLKHAAAVNTTRWLRFVCSKTVKAGEEQQRELSPVDN